MNEVGGTDDDRGREPGTGPATDRNRGSSPGDREATRDRGPGGSGGKVAPGTLVGRHPTDHLQPIGAAVLLAAGVGTFFSEPGLLLVAVVGVGALALRHAVEPPAPQFAVERRFSADRPDPGDRVTVETAVTNVGEATVADCRLVDLVPDEVTVVDGTPRHATALRPGERCVIEYDVRVPRGRHTFEGIYAIVADATATTEHEYELAAADSLTATPELRPVEVPILRGLTTPYAGRLATEKPGEGLEFHSVREYREGDALRRIDWNQYASTRQLTTLQFRTERSASVVLVADVRRAAYVRGEPTEPHAAERAVEAVGRLFATLLDDDHRAGVATLGPDYWLAPNDGTEHRRRLREALATEPALSPSRPERYYPVRMRTRRLLTRLSGMSQVVICSPLVDDEPEIAVGMLESAGHEVVVVSPDPTTADTPGNAVATLERRRRIRRIHALGVPVVDWPRGEDLGAVVARTVTGWSR